MSYWTYSDLFEEAGPPPTPFHGGFGLMTREGIRKPAWFAYRYLNMLRGREIPSADDQAMIATDPTRTAVLLWDWDQPAQTISNRPFFTRVLPTRPRRDAEVHFSNLRPGSYRLRVHRTGYRANDAHTRYLEMGSPAALSEAQLGELRALTRDLPETQRQVRVGRDGRFTFRLPMRGNDVILVMLERPGRPGQD